MRLLIVIALKLVFQVKRFFATFRFSCNIEKYFGTQSSIRAEKSGISASVLLLLVLSEELAAPPSSSRSLEAPGRKFGFIERREKSCRR